MLSELASQLRASRVLILFLFCASAWAQISLVHVTTCASPATTCVIPSTGSQNLLVVGWELTGGSGVATISSVSDNASNTYLEASGARAVDPNSNALIDLWYAKNTVAGATLLTITPSPAGTAGTAVIWEFSGADTNSPLDQASALNSQAATTTPSGPTVTAPAGELVISIAGVQGTVTGIASGNPFTNDSAIIGDGWAHLMPSAAGSYAAQWNASSGTYASSAVSFKAASSGGGPCDLNLDGVVNVDDVQLAVDMIPTSSNGPGMYQCTAKINGVCNASTVQLVVNASLGGPCVVTTTTHSATLNWALSASPNVTGYNVYRGTTTGGPYTKLNSSIVSTLTYTDNTVTAGQVYYYVVTAVDNTNTQSAYSNQAQASVPSP